jgi:phosphomevalonate kinase
MTKLNAFAKIKALFINENFNDAKLADGTLIQWEGELGEGTAIMVIDTDGNTTPAPDATHELSDGTLVSTVGGLVTKIEPKSEEVEEEEMAEAVDMKVYEERMMACEKKIEEMEKKMSEMFSAVESASANVDSKFNEIKEIVEAIAEEPIVEVEAPKNSTFKKEKPKQSAADRIAEWKKSNI